MAMGLAIIAMPLVAAANDGGQIATCAWPLKTTVDTLNVAFPDASAIYWTTPFTVTANLREIIVQGSYTDARYISVNAYNNSGSSYSCDGKESGLADFKIEADIGSSNPFQTSSAPGGAFTVSVVRSSKDASSTNVLPLPAVRCQPAPVKGDVPRNLGFLVFRVYLPTGGADAVQLPTLTLRNGTDAPVTLPPCAPADRGSKSTTSWPPELPPALVKRAIVEAQPCGRSGTNACPAELAFFRPTDSATGGLFPNTDNKYVGALVRPKAHKLVVVRARGATFPAGTHPAPWPSAAKLRYWSMCSNIYRRPWPVVTINDHGKEIVGCTADLDTPERSTGFYTYVVSRLRDRPTAATLKRNHATWLPFSRQEPEAQHLLILRNMLGDDFNHSIQNCTAGSTAAAIASCEASMGPYYPEAAECAVSTFVKGGTVACFAEHQRRG